MSEQTIGRVTPSYGHEAMRVLIAYDGSPGAATALELAGALPWPAGTVLRAVQVVGPAGDTSFLGSVAPLERADVTVDARVVRGAPAGDVLVAQARDFGADLVITGHRGHGPVTSVFLGSVAREVAEHAPCPVLVARTARCDRIVLAEDGSDGAYAARRLLATWPIFSGRRLHVVSVTRVRRPLLSGITAGASETARAARDETEMEVRVSYDRLASESADELRLAGLHATAEVRSGDPVERIVEAARETEADLVVVGTRGRGALARVLLGSVARGVLVSAPCSILVARERA